MKTVNWALPLATVAAYVLLVGYLGPQLVADAGGALPFDLRPMGYSLAEARAYLALLSPAGVALYLGPIRWADSLVPILVTATLCLPLRGRGQIWFLPALAYGLFDLAENVAVARLLHQGTDVEAQAVALASGCTQAKYLCLAVAVVLALFGLWQAWRKR
ncbi:hypothetical protein GC209_18100 [bacterium]|nr:hypothetical protein [bacterium]